MLSPVRTHKPVKTMDPNRLQGRLMDQIQALTMDPGLVMGWPELVSPDLAHLIGLKQEICQGQKLKKE